jgi:iron-sulfur cluster assembly protein
MNDITYLTNEPTMILEVTKLASEKILEAFKEDNTNPEALRIGIKGGGCSGFSYLLEFIKFEDIDPEDDEIYPSNPVPLVIDIFSKEYLKGTKLDYVLTLKESGFKFSNDKVKKTCGCGSSFSM